MSRLSLSLRALTCYLLGLIAGVPLSFALLGRLQLLVVGSLDGTLRLTFWTLAISLATFAVVL